MDQGCNFHLALKYISRAAFHLPPVSIAPSFKSLHISCMALWRAKSNGPRQLLCSLLLCGKMESRKGQTFGGYVLSGKSSH